MATPARRRRTPTPSASDHFIAWLFIIGLTISVGCLLIAGILTWMHAHPIGAFITTIIIVGIILITIYRMSVGHQRRTAQAAQRASIEAAQSMEIGRYHAMDPQAFEHAIAYLCHRDGCTSVSVVGGAGDLGADVLATAPDGRRIVIQCKRYGPTTKVGSQDMQRFGGTCWSVHGAHIAAMVTTSAFTRPAADYGTRQGIRLYDEQLLAGWATRTGPAPWM